MEQTVEETEIIPVEFGLTEGITAEQINAKIESLKEQYYKLTVTADDKESYSAVKTGWQTLQQLRLAVDKKRQEEKKPHLEKAGVIEARAKEIISAIQPIEKHLHGEWKKEDARKKKILEKKKEDERKRIADEEAAKLRLQQAMDKKKLDAEQKRIENEKADLQRQKDELEKQKAELEIQKQALQSEDEKPGTESQESDDASDAKNDSVMYSGSGVIQGGSPQEGSIVTTTSENSLREEPTGEEKTSHVPVNDPWVKVRLEFEAEYSASDLMLIELGFRRGLEYSDLPMSA